MSMHKTPLTEIERTGLEKHHLPVGAPSQLSDCFRLGVKHGLEANTPAVPDDFLSHKASWRAALVQAEMVADTHEDIAYYRHELRAFDAAYAALAASPQPVVQPSEEWIDDAGRIAWAMWRIQDLESKLAVAQKNLLEPAPHGCTRVSIDLTPDPRGAT